MGDWADGEFLKAKRRRRKTLDGSLIRELPIIHRLADGFTLARGAPHKEAAIAWLKASEARAQEAFNPVERFNPCPHRRRPFQV